MSSIRTPALKDIRQRSRPTRSMGGPRQSARVFDLPRISRQLLLAMTLLLLGVIAALGVRSAFHWVVSRPMFEIHQVRIQGELDQVDRVLISKRALALHGSFFSLDLRAAAAELRAVPWVRNVAVRRVWPDALEVQVEEHRPLARWGENELLNTFGERFVADYPGVLPYFQGPKGSEAVMLETYDSLRTRLSTLPLSITDLELSERGAWRLTADNGLEIELGREDIQARLSRFISVYPQLLRVAIPAGAVADLRYTHGFALRMVTAGKDAST
jgi:cell division protein FtsQ